MNKQSLMLSVIARTLVLGRGHLETALSLERTVFIPILHDKYEISINEHTGEWDWFFSYAYLTEDRLREIDSGESILRDEDYQDSAGEILYIPYGTGHFSNSQKSEFSKLALKGSASYVVCHRSYNDPKKKSKLSKVKVRTL